MGEAPLHPFCQPVAFLLGTWSGQGRGGYPTLDDFVYDEEVRFTHVGRPYLAFVQRAWRNDAAGVRQPSHYESGFVRCNENGRLELVVAMAGGRIESAEGTISGGRIRFESRAVINTATANEATAVERRWWQDGERLRYEVEMAALGRPMSWHLSAELRRA